MQYVQETNLAWSLIDAAKPELDARERNHVFVSVGAGDAFTAIRILLKLIEVKQIPLPYRLVQMCRGWLQANTLHDDHDQLQMVIEGLTVAGPDLQPRANVRSFACARSSEAGHLRSMRIGATVL